MGNWLAFKKQSTALAVAFSFLFLVASPFSVHAQSVTFSRSLSVGSSGSDVTALQSFLKALGFYTYPTITGYFGPVTVTAVEAYQKAHGIDPIGIVGPQTQASINGISGTSSGSSTSVTTPVTTTTAVSPGSFTQTLDIGSTGSQVTALQTFLKALGFYTYPTITGFFGTVTQTAVKAYQAAHGISAIGTVGPQTRASLNQSASTGGTTTTTTTTTTTSTGGTTTTGTTAPVVTHSGGGGGGGSDVAGGGSQVIPATVISSVSGGTPSGTATTITWVTDELATSQVSYGQTSSYGITTAVDTNPVTFHSVTITGLASLTTYHFQVISQNASGIVTSSSDQTFVSGTGADITPPTVALTAPSNGTTVSSTTVALSATASDNVAVAGVQFEVDGAPIGALVTSGPYAYTWDSSTVADGSHTISAVTHDTSGNYATSSVSVIVDNSAPARSAGSPSSSLALNTTSTTISLTTNENATCKYSTSAGTTYASMANTFSTTGGTSHSNTITGLTNGGSYVYYVRCQDAVGNFNKSDYAISFTVANDSTSPVVSITAPANNATVSGSSLSITATATDDVSVAGVQFELDGFPLGSEETNGPYSISFNTTSVVDGTHAVVAVARDGSGNYATSTTVSIKVDNTAPVISSISSSAVAQTVATIGWVTNESATSQVQYGLTTSYGSTTTLDPTLVKPHSVSLSGLTPASVYHYRVISADGQGNTSTSGDQTFTTSAVLVAPTVTTSAASSVTGVSATFNGAITADGNASSTAEGFVYGLTTSYTATSTNSGTFGVGSFSTSSPTLSPSTTYHYRAYATNPIGTSYGSDQSFTTSALPAPTISSISAAPGLTTATITWTTDQAASSTVSYGLTTSYGSASTTDSFVTSHSITLTGLATSTVYHYKVGGANTAGTASVSSDLTLTTATPSDVTPPTVALTTPTNASTVAGSSVSLSATATDNVAVVGVQFKLDGTINIGSEQTGSSPYSTTWNSTAVSDGAHTVSAVARDAAGNYATSTVSITTDNTAPLISSISAGTPAQTTATITWNTNENSTSVINFGTTTGYGTSSSSPTLVTSHSITLTGLTAGTTYHYQVSSVDASGNTAITGDQTFVTSNSIVIPTVTTSAASSISTSTVTFNGAITATGNTTDTAEAFNYGLTTSYTATTTNSGSFGLGSFTATSPALTPGTTYHYRAYATNSAGVGYGSDQSFTTNSLAAPTISAISSGTTTATTATITWTTDQAASSTVLYGTTTSYGTASTSVALVTSHSLTLTGLTGGTTYHFQVGGANSAGTVSTSSDQTFTTAVGSLSATVTPTQTVNEITPATFSPSITGGTAPYTYFWDFGDLAVSASSTVPNTTMDATTTVATPTHEYNYLGVFNAVLKVTDSASNVAYATSTVTVNSVLPIVAEGAGYRGYPIAAVPSGSQLPGIDYTVGSRIPYASLTEVDPTNVISVLGASFTTSQVQYSAGTVTIKASGITLSGYLFKNMELNVGNTAISSTTISDDIFEYTPAYAGFHGIYVTAGAASTTITHIEIDGGRNNMPIDSAILTYTPTNITYSYFHGMPGDTLDPGAPGEIAYNFVGDGAWSSANHGDAIQEDSVRTGFGISSGCAGTISGQSCIHDNIVDPTNYILQGAGGNGSSGAGNNSYRLVSELWPSIINVNVYNNVFLPSDSYTLALQTADYPMSNVTLTNNFVLPWTGSYIYPNTGGAIFPNDISVINSKNPNTGTVIPLGPSAATFAMTLSLDNSTINYTGAASPHTATFTLKTTGYAFQYGDTVSVTLATTSTTCATSNLSSSLASQIATALTGITGLAYNSSTGIITFSAGFSGSVAIPITSGGTDPGANCNVVLSLTNPSAGLVTDYIMSGVSPQAGGAGYSVGDLINVAGYATVPVTSVTAGSVTSVGPSVITGHVPSVPANPLAQYVAGQATSTTASGTGATFNLSWIAPGAKTSTLLTTTASYDASSTAIFNGLSGNGCTASSTEKGYIDTWVRAAKADGTFYKMGGVYFLQSLAGCGNKDAYTNWMAPTTFATASGTITCTTKYCKSNGTNSLLDTGLTEASTGGTQNNAALGLYVNGTLNSQRIELGAQNFYIQPNPTGVASARINAATANVFTSGAGIDAPPFPGGFAVTRTSSTSITGALKDGSNVATTTNITAAPTTSNLYLLGANTTPGINYGSNQDAFAFFGVNMTAADLSNALTDAYNYLVSLGAQ